MTQMFTTGDEPGEMYRDLSLDSGPLPEDVKKELLEEILSNGECEGPNGWVVPVRSAEPLLQTNDHFDRDAVFHTATPTLTSDAWVYLCGVWKDTWGRFIKVYRRELLWDYLYGELWDQVVPGIFEPRSVRYATLLSIDNSIRKAVRRASGEAVLTQEKIIRIFRRCFVDKGFFDKHFKPKLLELLNQDE